MTDPQDSNSLVYMLGQIDAKVTHLLAGQTHTNDRLEKHESRIQAVERSYWRIAGIASIIPTLVAIVGIAFSILPS